jgi:aryl-alcohol dehydrogenase-like predicted oxidoreductase
LLPGHGAEGIEPTVRRSEREEHIMYTRRLGESDLFITPVGFGAWAIGGSGWSFAWGAQSDADSVAVIHKALDAGMNWIDTAAVYGLGHSEEIVARALRGGRWPPYIFTKCAMIWNERKEISYRLKADSIRRECEASLRRLQVEVIDLSQEIAPITSLQPPYSLINRKMEQEVLPFAVQEHIGVITYSPMASGLLTGAMTRERIARLPADDWRRTSPNFQEPLLSRNLRLVGLLRSIGDRRRPSPWPGRWFHRCWHISPQPRGGPQNREFLRQRGSLSYLFFRGQDWSASGDPLLPGFSGRRFHSEHGDERTAAAQISRTRSRWDSLDGVRQIHQSFSWLRLVKNKPSGKKLTSCCPKSQWDTVGRL